MTYHESYGELPKTTLQLYRRFNVSPADHDILLMRFGQVPVWERVNQFVLSHSVDGSFRYPYGS